jgi:hypothetical protein
VSHRRTTPFSYLGVSSPHPGFSLSHHLHNVPLLILSYLGFIYKEVEYLTIFYFYIRVVPAPPGIFLTRHPPSSRHRTILFPLPIFAPLS